MQYQILVQPQAQNGYVATVFGLPECVAEAVTKEEAIAGAKAALAQRLTQTEIVPVEMEAPLPRPAAATLLSYYGRFKDDPDFDDFLAEIEKYRRELDAEEANQ